MDFDSAKTKILLNPKINPTKQAHIFSLIERAEMHDHFSGHIILASSGTTKTDHDDFKLVALSKTAILTSAHAVNQHLKATSQDIWLNSLPEFHVGGLGILARAYLTDSKIVEFPSWEPNKFVTLTTSHKVTLTSLVPAQVFDLCSQNLKAPASLRSVIVGGGAINEELYKKACSLGWPLMISYGLTEVASQVATSKLNSQKMSFLSHIEAKANSDGFLTLKSPSLLTAYIFIADNKISVSDPKKDGFLTTEDLGHINGKAVTILGRLTDFIKIGGEGVIFSHLEKRFEDLKLTSNLKTDAAIIPYPDDRLGFVVHLASISSDTTELVQKFNSLVMPYERIRHVHYIDKIPRTVLKKLCKAELLQSLTKPV